MVSQFILCDSYRFVEKNISVEIYFSFASCSVKKNSHFYGLCFPLYMLITLMFMKKYSYFIELCNTSLLTIDNSTCIYDYCIVHINV